MGGKRAKRVPSVDPFARQPPGAGRSKEKRARWRGRHADARTDAAPPLDRATEHHASARQGLHAHSMCTHVFFAAGVTALVDEIVCRLPVAHDGLALGVCLRAVNDDAHVLDAPARIPLVDLAREVRRGVALQRLGAPHPPAPQQQPGQWQASSCQTGPARSGLVGRGVPRRRRPSPLSPDHSTRPRRPGCSPTQVWSVGTAKRVGVGSRVHPR